MNNQWNFWLIRSSRYLSRTPQFSSLCETEVKPDLTSVSVSRSTEQYSHYVIQSVSLRAPQAQCKEKPTKIIRICMEIPIKDPRR